MRNRVNNWKNTKLLQLLFFRFSLDQLLLKPKLWRFEPNIINDLIQILVAMLPLHLHVYQSWLVLICWFGEFLGLRILSFIQTILASLEASSQTRQLMNHYEVLVQEANRCSCKVSTSLDTILMFFIWTIFRRSRKHWFLWKWAYSFKKAALIAGLRIHLG